MTADTKMYEMSNDRPFIHGGKMQHRALSIFVKTLTDVLIFLGASIGFIVQVSVFSSYNTFIELLFSPLIVSTDDLYGAHRCKSYIRFKLKQ